jgi:hypothetical protein
MKTRALRGLRSCIFRESFEGLQTPIRRYSLNRSGRQIERRAVYPWRAQTRKARVHCTRMLRSHRPSTFGAEGQRRRTILLTLFSSMSWRCTGFSLGTIFCQPITGTLGKSTNRLHCAISLFKTGMRRLLLREEWLRAKQRKQQGLGRIETRRVYEDLRRVKPSYHGHYINLVYCDSAYTEDSGFSFSPVQQFGHAMALRAAESRLHHYRG